MFYAKNLKDLQTPYLVGTDEGIRWQRWDEKRLPLLFATEKAAISAGQGMLSTSGAKAGVIAEPAKATAQ